MEPEPSDLFHVTSLTASDVPLSSQDAFPIDSHESQEKWKSAEGPDIRSLSKVLHMVS